MAVRVVCRACGKRLKLPDGPVRGRSAKCPKCRAPVDLTPALEESAYLPTVAIPTIPARAEPAKAAPTKAASRKSAPQTRGESQTKSESQKAAESGGLRPPLAQPLSLDPEPLSLDDGPAPATAPAEPPFRVPVRVIADSARLFVGPCVAVIVPHGVFLEVEPLKPFLYVPIGCPTDSAAPGELTATLPDGRAVTTRVKAPYARPLARDLCSFLAGERPAPVAAEYGREWWLLGVAALLALGTAAGPLVLTQTANVELQIGLAAGGAFALLALLANAGVVLLSRWSVLAQLAVMACSCFLMTGVFLFGATAYLAGRQKATAEQQQPGAEPPPSPNPPPAPPPNPLPPEPARPPSHVDKAYQSGVSALEDGPADVTALSISPDGSFLGIGYADGTTRVWPFDQPTFDSMLPGPKVDGPVSRVQFDPAGKLLFVASPTGVVAVPRSGSPAVPAKLNGPFVAIAPELSGDRVRVAALRGGALAHRLLPSAFVLNPPSKAKGFATPTPKDEITPMGVTADPKLANPTFLAWTHSNRLLAGSADGSVSVWSVQMKPEPANRDHKAPVKAWAASAATGDFVTGDEKGNVAVWPFKGAKPTVGPVLTTPVVGLSFAPSGAWFAATDNTGWLAIVEVPTLKVVQRKKLAAPVKALAFGPNDDVMILGNGKVVEVWWLPELLK